MFAAGSGGYHSFSKYVPEECETVFGLHIIIKLFLKIEGFRYLYKEIKLTYSHLIIAIVALL